MGDWSPKPALRAALGRGWTIDWAPPHWEKGCMDKPGFIDVYQETCADYEEYEYCTGRKGEYGEGWLLNESARPGCLGTRYY